MNLHNRRKIMKRIVILAMAIAFSITTIGYVYGLPPKAAAVKEGKALVKTLPKGVEGVELVRNKVRLKSGFKFAKRTNGTVTVARMAGGHGVGGEWNCTCTGSKGETGTCSTTISGDLLYCIKGSKDTCTGTCRLSVTIKGITSGVIIY